MKEQDNTLVTEIQGQEDVKSHNLRKIALLSTIGLLDFIPISLYQLGVIKHLPDFPGEIFDSDKVNASKEAQIAGLPDGPFSLFLYASNLLLTSAAIGRKKKHHVFEYLLAANSIGQAAGGAFYLYNMIKVQKKICPYCVAGALINFATLIPLKRLLMK